MQKLVFIAMPPVKWSSNFPAGILPDGTTLTRTRSSKSRLYQVKRMTLYTHCVRSFARRYGDSDSYGYFRDAVITPVKYSYEELWRWQLLLDRFAVSLR